MPAPFDVQDCVEKVAEQATLSFGHILHDNIQLARLFDQPRPRLYVQTLVKVLTESPL